MPQNTSSHNRSVVLDGLRAASATFASHRAIVRLLRSVKFLLGALVLLCLADITFHFDSTPRFILTCSLGATIILLGFLSVYIAYFARPKLEKAARDLEERNVKLGSKLTNLLQLHEQANDSAVAPLTRDLARRAIDESVEKVEPGTLAKLARFPRMKVEIKHALTSACVFAILVLLLGEPARRQLMRFLSPWGDYPALSFTWLEISKPGEDGIEVIYGESERIEVIVKGHKPKELILKVVPTDGSGPERTFPMTSKVDGSFVATLDNIRKPLTLTAWNKSGRSRSPKRQLSVQLIPQIEDAEIEISPPAYTGLKPRKQKFRFAGLQALEGSEITFRLRSNRPLGEGSLIATLPKDQTSSTPLLPISDGPKNEAVAKITATDSGRLVFRVRDVDQREAIHTPSASLTVSRDLSPQIGFLNPSEDSFIVEDHLFDLQLSASDDYGLRTLRLFVAINETYRKPEEINFDGVGPRRHTVDQKLSLAQLGAKPGDVITLHAETIDNCPTPHLARTEMRRLEVISVEQYNEYLRKQHDVADIAGKYEDILDRFQELVDAQEKLAEKEHSEEEQQELNEELEKLAKEMSEFGRENPVYDFEKDLQNQLQEMSERIKDSIAQNKEAPPGKKSAQEHHERLAQTSKDGEEKVREPLEDLAAMHELIKDFNEYLALYQEQKALAEQTKRFDQTKHLSPLDKMSLQQMAPRQREIASALENLAQKLEQHADMAEEKFPKAAQSARDLSNAIAQGDFPVKGRNSSQAMLSSQGQQSHDRATHLEEEMSRLLGQCKSCQSGQGNSLDRYLSLNQMQPGNNFEQMMQSLSFGPMGSSGGTGTGMGGSMATGAMLGQQQALMGGEAMMSGKIAGRLSGGKGPGPGEGSSGEGVAKVDREAASQNSLNSSRETQTPESQALFQEYQDLTDAYFRTLTQPETK